MNLSKRLSIVAFVVTVFSSLVIAIMINAQENTTSEQVLDIMSTAHRGYQQIHVRYSVEIGGIPQTHEVWLDSGSDAFRHEIGDGTSLQQTRISNGSYIFENPGPAGSPITLQVLPTSGETTLANQMLGGIGTLISPVFAVQNRLSQSEVRLVDIETFETARLAEPLNVARLYTQLSGFGPAELWVDLETGIIVREIIYNQDGSIFSETNLELLEINPAIDSSIFAVDSTQYNIDQLREIFPPVEE